MRALVHQLWGDVEAHCPACRRDPELRLRWGCDRPAEGVVCTITCSGCNGGNPECPVCQGRGEEARDRCPESGNSPELAEAFAAYSAWDAHGVLPIAGGWLAQSVEFLNFVAVVNAERGEIERAREREEAGRRGR